MEIFIDRVPERTREKALKEFLSRSLDNITKEPWNCFKFKGKPNATLTFLKAADGKRFLDLHGRQSSRPGLNFNGVLLRCSESRNKADPTVLRSLEFEKKTGLQRPAPARLEEQNVKTLGSKTVSCGIWDYIESELAFKAYTTWRALGKVTFHSKFMRIPTGLTQLEIRYTAIESITSKDCPNPALIFTLIEAPVFVESRELNALFVEFRELKLLLDELSMQASGRDKGPMRLSGVDEEHEKMAGSCLVYRVDLEEGCDSDWQARALRNIPGNPELLHRQIRFVQPEQSFAAELAELLETLASTTSGLAFTIKFQLQKLALDGYLPPYKVMRLIAEVRRINERSGERVCANAIRRLFLQLPYAGPATEPASFAVSALENRLKANEERAKQYEEFLEEPFESENVASVHKAMVTPAGVYLNGPTAESNNRVLRKYAAHHDYFLRVEFRDEDGLPLQYSPRASNDIIYRERFIGILNHGINICGRQYSFLGFSHSSLRSQSCWFMAPFTHNRSLLLQKELIKGLGDFSHIRIPARCAARIGQAFTDTRVAVKIDPKIVKEMPDVIRNGRVFSDGVGTISRLALQDVWAELPARRRSQKPTVLQIRYQGAKGMLSLDSNLKDKSIFLRKSMIKFQDPSSCDLEICTAGYKPLDLYLNEQLIKILEDMGVQDSFFLELQAREIERLRLTTSSAINAATFLKAQSIGQRISLPWFIKTLPDLKLAFQADDFLCDVVEMAVAIELRALKYKARIPVSKGYTLLGVLDETGFLEEGQIFCAVEVDGKIKALVGGVMVTRSPALHPGDVQRATAVVAPQDSPLHRLRNCICFSQKGSRDLPSMLSGGDLDGDHFHIIFDGNARYREVFPPADYPRPDLKELDREVSRDDMTDFFITFMESDQLGRICNVHKALADYSEQGVLDPGCKKLAGMASTAVDFSKTGIPVDMKEMPKYGRYRPDFMKPGPHVKVVKEKPLSFEEKSTDTLPGTDTDEDDVHEKSYYPSTRILGKLYRAIEEDKIFERIQSYKGQTDRTGTSRSPVLNGVWSYVRHNCSDIDWESHLDLARWLQAEYEECMTAIMIEYSTHPKQPLSETEVFAGNILGKTGAQTKRQRELSITMKERFETELGIMIRYMTGKQAHGVEDDDDEAKTHEELDDNEGLGRSIACLYVGFKESNHAGGGGYNLRGFARVAAAVCLKECVKAKKKSEAKKRSEAKERSEAKK